MLRSRESRARIELGILLAATVRGRLELDETLCRWLLAYREEFHGRVTTWLEDVLRDARRAGAEVDEDLPHDLAHQDRFHAWALPMLGAPPPGDDRVEEAARAFSVAIANPLALTLDDGSPRYPWRFAGDGAKRLARAFAEARLARPDAPLAPELQVVLARLLEAAEAGPDHLIEVPEDLRLRKLVALNSELYRAKAVRQATDLDWKQFRKVREHAEALLWDEERREWWQECLRRRTARRRQRAAWSAVAFVRRVTMKWPSWRWLSWSKPASAIRGSLSNCENVNHVTWSSCSRWFLKRPGSKRWGYVKKEFAKSWLSLGHLEQPISQARRREGRRGVWVPRFLEHTIRDDHDFRGHMNYIHHNPVKHGYVRCPHAWHVSSFHRSLRRGLYEPEWGCACRGAQHPHPSVMNFDDIEDTVGEDRRKWAQIDFGRSRADACPTALS